MPSSKIEMLERALKREKEARKAAEDILEQKSTELYQLSEELKASNKKLARLLTRKKSELEGIFENIIDAYVVIKVNGEVIEMNQAAEQMFGYKTSEENFNINHLVKPEYQEYTEQAFRDLIKQGKYSNYQAVILTKDGQEKIVQINASAIYDEDGRAVAAHGIARDVTEEVELKKLSEQQRQQLDIIFRNSRIGFSLSDSNGVGLIMVNQALCDMLGYTREDFKTLTVKDLTHPDDAEESRLYREKMFRGEIDSFTVKKRYITKAGDTVWARTSVSGVKDDKGNIEYMVATVEDDTEQVMANKKLQESENRMSTLIMNLQTGILLEDENRKISLTNEKFCNLFGIEAPPQALLGADCSNAAEENKVYFKNEEEFVDSINEILQNKEPVFNQELFLKDGRIFDRSYVPIYNNGNYKGHLWSYDDVTLSRKYKSTLKAQKEKYSNIIANMNLGLLEVDMDNRVILANQSFQDMSGYSEAELLGKQSGKLLLLEEYYWILGEHGDNRDKGVTDSYEIKIRKKNGEIRDWLVSATPNYDVQGNLIGSIGIHLDITEQKKLAEKQVQLLDDLEVQNQQLNDYAHIVSHDLKSPLRNISALISWTKDDFAGRLGEESLTNLDLMQDRVEKMDHLIENILKYSSISRSSISNEKIDTQSLVEDIVSIIYIPPNVEVEIQTKLPPIFADSTRIQQLFQNLISNAVNYIDKEKGKVEIGHKTKGKDYVFYIKDNGCGIPKKHFDNIFKMFTSTANHEKSTGIGLSIVRKILDLYDSEIWLESEPGVGTTFYFNFRKS